MTEMTMERENRRLRPKPRQPPLPPTIGRRLSLFSLPLPPPWSLDAGLGVKGSASSVEGPGFKSNQLISEIKMCILPDACGSGVGAATGCPSLSMAYTMIT